MVKEINFTDELKNSNPFLFDRIKKALKFKSDEELDLFLYRCEKEGSDIVRSLINLLPLNLQKEVVDFFVSKYEIDIFAGEIFGYVFTLNPYNLVLNEVKEVKENDISQEDKHTIWYKKYVIDDDLSFRYYYKFKDRPEYECKWVIKSHSKKRYGIVDIETVKLMKHLIIDVYEIIGKQTGKGYKKYIIKDDMVEIKIET